MILKAKYCSQCGHPAVGKFCVECGAKLVAPGDGTASVDDHQVVDDVITNWHEELRYDVLMKVPEIRSMIEQHAEMAANGPSAEEIFAVFEKAIGHGVPMAKLAAVVQPIFTKWGISTGKERKEYVNAPIGKVIVRVLCSLARYGQTMKNAVQATDGCCFHAVLPSDLWALKGSLVVTVQQHNRGANVSASTKIGGSYYDWGKSRACLERLFKDVQVDPSCWEK